jgi:hypothetical protein
LHYTTCDFIPPVTIEQNFSEEEKV